MIILANEFLKDILINLIAVLTMSAKLTTSDVLTAFWNRDYGIVI